METVFDGKLLYKVTRREECKNGEVVFQARPLELPNNEEMRRFSEKRLEGDLQIEGYILIGWYQGCPKGGHYVNWNKNKKHGYTSEPGRAAYYPITGPRWVYIWQTHGRYAPHPDPIWENKRWAHFVEIDDKPQRISSKKMLALLTTPKPPYDGVLAQNNVWMPSVPLWLLNNKQDMRSVYLAGGKP